MNKYVGKYRVDIERCTDTGDVIEDAETYLRCVSRNKGGKVYRWDENVLVCYVESSISKAKNMVKQIEERNVEVIKLVEYADEADIHFYEKDLDSIADIICITTSGAKINPRSIKNHPRKEEIRQERFDSLSEEEKEQLRLKGEMLKSFRKNDNN